MICMTRADFRMIHGQVASVWIPHYSATKVVIIDDTTSKDTFVQQILTFAAPKGTSVEFYNVEDGVAKYKEDQFGNGKIIVIFRSIEQAYQAYMQGFEFESINVGQTPRESNQVHDGNSICVKRGPGSFEGIGSERGVCIFPSGNFKTGSTAGFCYKEDRR